MKYLIYCGTFLLTLLTACKTTQNNTNGSEGQDSPPKAKAIIPYDMGNYWVYKYVFHLNENTAKPDTLKVLRHEQTEQGLKVDLNSQKWMVKAQGDSIFVRCQGRGGGEFIQPLYHRTEKSSEFSTCKGDVLMRAKVERLAEPMKVNGKSYKNVYRFEITPQEIFYLSDGIGVIKWEYYNVQNKLMTERILIDYKLK